MMLGQHLSQILLETHLVQALQGFLEDDDDHNYVALKRERMSDTEIAQWVEMIPKVAFLFLFNCV